MKTEYIGKANVPDGFFRDKLTAHLCFDPSNGVTYAVHEFGWYRSEIPNAVDAIEAEWLISHHPICKGRITL